MAAYESLLALIPEQLAKGNVVELGDFGSIWLRDDASGTLTAESVTISNITRVAPRFNPGKEFKKVLDTIEFEKA